jgi:hypothetical protein
MKKYICVLVTSLLIFIGLTACSNEPRELTVHEPGEYKGTPDPLVAKGQHLELDKRFMQVQTDR